jgi:hypothetical protein
VKTWLQRRLSDVSVKRPKSHLGVTAITYHFEAEPPVAADADRAAFQDFLRGVFPALDVAAARELCKSPPCDEIGGICDCGPHITFYLGD